MAQACRDAAIKALRVCPRNLFVTEQHQDEAFSDSPVRLHDLDFNVSAPHMHASCLEALQLQPGHRLLDVGCGSGLINACAAYIVGHCIFNHNLPVIERRSAQGCGYQQLRAVMP